MRMNKLNISRVLLVAAILMIVAFQLYWLNKLYKDEKQALKKETNGVFRDLVYNMQVERFKADTLFYRQKAGNNLFMFNAVNELRHRVSEIKKKPDIKKTGIVPGEANTVFIVNDRNHDSSFFKNKNRIKIPDGPMPPELAMILEKEHEHGLPPVTDTSLIRQMAEGIGIKMVVRSNAKKNNTTHPLRENTISSVSVLKGSPEVRINTDSFIRRSNAKLDVNFDVQHPEKAFIRMITDGKALDDTIPVAKLDSAYKKELVKTGIPISFSIKMGKDDSLHRKDTVAATQFRTSPAIIGFVHPYWYQAEFENPAGYLVKKLSPQILFSLFLVAFTSLAFIFLYRNLMAQQRLTVIKNDFISNITHELKTPIATVNVAIEALRNFGGLQSPERTKEYLDISASELQRLSLLVDKVLKLSMFENHEITLQKESFDLQKLIVEVMLSMKLQFEKQKAVTEFETTDQNFMIDADKLHITSVVYNLLDNALKYSKENPQVSIRLIRQAQYFELRVSDNGIGIPDAYRSKIFEQFFRVPSGDRHNTKGYGLGLSYVNHIVRSHHGFIEVESELGKGSTFIVRIPFAETDSVDFGNGRKIIKKKFKLG